jgi:hypothetical protein
MHRPDVSYLGDLMMVGDTLSGDEQAARVFVERFRPDLERYLAARCRRGIPGPLKSPGKFLRMSFLTVSARRIGLGAKTSS